MDEAAARRLTAELLQHPALAVQGTRQVLEVWSEGTTLGVVTQQPEATRAAVVAWDTTTGRLQWFAVADRPPWLGGSGVVGEQEVVANITGFLNRWLPTPAGQTRELATWLVRPTHLVVEDGRLTVFAIYRDRRTGAEAGTTEIDLSAADGRLLKLHFEPAPSAPPDAISLDAARQRALPLLARLLGQPTSQVQLLFHEASWRHLQSEAPEFWFWFAATRRGSPGNTTRVAYVGLDHTGKILLRETEQVSAEDLAAVQRPFAESLRLALRPPATVIDAWPAWGPDNDRVYFLTTRSHLGAGPLMRRTAVAVAPLADQTLACVEPGWWLRGMPGLFRPCFTLRPDGRGLLTALSWGELQMTDWASGERQVSDGWVGANHGLDQCGGTVVTATPGYREPSTISWSTLDPQRPALAPRRRLLTDGAVRTVCLGNDGDGLYCFVAPSGETHDAISAVPQPGQSGNITYVPLPLPQAHAPRVIASRTVSQGWRGVTRLSRVGDEPHLLVSAANGLWYLDLDRGQRQALRPEPLRDPDTTEPLEPLQAQVSPNGELIAFVARLRPTAQQDVYQCLYVCDRAGNSLRRLSPRDDPLMPMVDAAALERAKAWWWAANREATRAQ